MGALFYLPWVFLALGFEFATRDRPAALNHHSGDSLQQQIDFPCLKSCLFFDFAILTKMC